VFYSLVTAYGVTVGDAAAMLATTPARVARLDHVGVIEAGRRADFACFEFDGALDLADPANNAKIRHSSTVVAGQVVYSVAEARKAAIAAEDAKWVCPVAS